jgi:hypothetical protein
MSDGNPLSYFFDDSSEEEKIPESVLVEEANTGDKTDYLEGTFLICHLVHPSPEKIIIAKNALKEGDLLTTGTSMYKITQNEETDKKDFKVLNDKEYELELLNSPYEIKFHIYRESEYRFNDNLKTIELFVKNNSKVNIGDIIEAIYTNDTKKVYRVLNKSADNLKLETISVPELRISGGKKGKKKTMKKKSKKAKKAKKTNKKKGK